MKTSSQPVCSVNYRCLDYSDCKYILLYKNFLPFLYSVSLVVEKVWDHDQVYIRNQCEINCLMRKFVLFFIRNQTLKHKSKIYERFSTILQPNDLVKTEFSGIFIMVSILHAIIEVALFSNLLFEPKMINDQNNLLEKLDQNGQLFI